MVKHFFPASFYKNNRSRLVPFLSKGSLAIFHSADFMPRNGDQYYPFRQCSDFLYLTGIEQEMSILLLAPGHYDPKMREVLLILNQSAEQAVWEGKKLSKEAAANISGIETIYYLNQLDLLLQSLMIWAERVYLNVEEKPKFSTRIQSANLRFAHEIMQQYPLHELKRAAPLMRKLRMVKTREEIHQIKNAIGITQKAFERILRFVKPGVTEYQVQAELEHEMRFHNAGNHAFYPIIASGENACVLHYNQNRGLCHDGDLLLLDFGAEYGYYAADISRTIPVNGKFSKRQRQLYDLVLDIQKAAIEKFLPGNTLKEVNNFVLKAMEKALISAGLLKDAKAADGDFSHVKKFFMHGVAHHLGMDVHDTFDQNEPFVAGMVFTCEPGVYIHDEKLGIRLENIIQITENGPVDLSEAIPILPDEIEKQMQQK
jgi:Xaa-Pro aminopeptidase